MQDANVAVITGGTGALGRAIVPLLIRRKFKLAVSYIIPEEASEFEDEVGFDNDEGILRRVDCTDPEQVAAFMNEVAEAYGTVNVLCSLVGAWAGGRGDQLEPVSLGDRHYVLVFPDVHVSTADLFAAADLKRDCASVDFNGFDPLTGVNVFEPVVRARHPAVDQAMRELQAHGRPRLTGTGSCIFLPVEDKFSAESITHQLECRYNVCCVDGVDRSPVLAKRTGGN